MKKMVMMLGSLLIAGSGMAYAGGCCGGNGYQDGVYSGGFGAPNLYQRKTSHAPIGSQFPRSK